MLRNDCDCNRTADCTADHGCTVDQVHMALDHYPVELDRDTFLKRTLAMELVELELSAMTLTARP
jgi:hypothetical protein